MARGKIHEVAQSTVMMNGKQAEDEMKRLTTEADKFAKKKREAFEKNDHTAYKKWDQELKTINKQMKNMRMETQSVESVLKNLNGASLLEIERAARKATMELKKMAQTDPGYKEKAKQAEQLNTKVREMNKELRGATEAGKGFFDKMTSGFNKYFGIVSTFLASFTGLMIGFKRISEETAKMDDAYSDVMKTTGMTRDEVLALNEVFKKMDTRTAREELNKLAKEAGKLNLTSAQDVLDFTEGGNQIRVALGEDLGADAILLIGKMVDVYKNATDQLKSGGLKEQLLMVGSAINELGAKSSASEQYLVDFAGRLGGVSKQAKLGIGDIMGYASSLDQDMQQVEMSATAFQNFIMKLMGEPAKFAKLAGLEVKSFTKLVSTDANQAIKLFLRSLNEKGGFQQLIPIFDAIGLDGARAVGVLSSLAGSIDKVEVAQQVANKALAEGTSITKEYEIKNNNLAAQKEKNKKLFLDTAIALGEKLTPAMMMSTNSITYAIKALTILLDFTARYGATLLSAAVTIASYTAILKLKTLWTTRATAGTLFNTIAIKANVLAKEAAIAATNLFAAAQMVLTGNIKGANQAMRIFWATLKLNPYILLASTIIGAAAGITLYLNRKKELTEIEKANIAIEQKVTDSFGDQKVKVELLRKAIEDNNLALWYRKKKLEELKTIVPGYNASLSDEGVLINNNKKSIEDYLVALEKQIKLKATQEEYEELYRKRRKTEQEIRKKELEYEAKKNELDKGLENPMNSFYSLKTAQSISLLATETKLNDARQLYLELSQAILAIEKEIATTSNSIVGADPAGGDGGVGGGGTTTAAGRSGVLPSLTAIGTPAGIESGLSQSLQEAYEENKLELLRQRADMLITEEEYNMQMENLELTHLMTTLEMRRQLGLDTIDIETQLLNKKIALQKEFTVKSGEEVDEQLEKQKQAARHILTLSSFASSAIEDYIGGNENALKEGAKQMIGYALDLLKTQTELAIAGATIQSLMQPDSVATLGASGFVRAAIIVGLIEAAFAGVKGLANRAIDGFEQGGYTGSGSRKKVAGVVHANEFVGNALATANPTVRPAFDLINYAQQNGTVSNLNLPAAMAASGMMSPASTGTTHNVSLDASMMMAVALKFEAILEQFKKDGISATLVYQDFKRMATKESRAISKTK